MAEPAPGAGPRVVLASASPRRVELLGRLLGPDTFEVIPGDIDESPLGGESPVESAERLAGAKASTVAELTPDAIVIGADTVVDLDGEVLGKPDDATHAARLLRRLSGRTHHVHTGVSVRTPQGSVAWVESAEVAFGVLGRAEIEVYVLTGEPLDKAGAYAIQGGAGAFVTALAGDVDTVIGLPLRRLGGELARLGVSVAPPDGSS